MNTSSSERHNETTFDSFNDIQADKFDEINPEVFDLIKSEAFDKIKSAAPSHTKKEFYERILGTSFDSLPKSYLAEDKLQYFIENGAFKTPSSIASVEATASMNNDDWENMKAWCALTAPSTETLVASKKTFGKEWIIEMNINTEIADKELGEGWLYE